MLDGPQQGASRAWQLVAGAERPDETVAAALELVAADAARRGATTSAARTLEGAAALTPAADRRRDRLVAATRTWLAAADIDAATRVADGLTAVTATAEAATVTAAALRLGRGAAPALTYAQSAVTAAPPRERADIEAVLASELLEAGAADDAVAVAEPPAPRSGAASRLAHAVLALATGRPADPVPGTDRTEIEAGSVLAERARALAMTAGVEAGRAHEVIAATRPILSVGGERLRMGVSRARAQLACGDVVGGGDELVRLDALVPEGAGPMRGSLDLALAEVELLVGRRDAARDRVDQVTATAAELGLGGLRAHAEWLRGRLALADGDHAEGLASLRAACRVGPHLRLADLIAAATAAGRPNEATVRAAELRGLVDHPDPTVAIRARRARGSAGGPGGFADALSRADTARLPLEAAEVLMAIAESAQREGDSEAAGSAAAEAAERLDVLGVPGWDGRLAALRRDGRPPAVSPLTDQLSPAEHRVALVVGEGRTNQEAADALFLSVKTVDFHLQNIYRKLGLRSRTELAVLVQRGGEAA